MYMKTLFTYIAVTPANKRKKSFLACVFFGFVKEIKAFVDIFKFVGFRKCESCESELFEKKIFGKPESVFFKDFSFVNL